MVAMYQDGFGNAPNQPNGAFVGLAPSLALTTLLSLKVCC